MRGMSEGPKQSREPMYRVIGIMPDGTRYKINSGLTWKAAKCLAANLKAYDSHGKFVIEEIRVRRKTSVKPPAPNPDPTPE